MFNHTHVSGLLTLIVIASIVASCGGDSSDKSAIQKELARIEDKIDDLAMIIETPPVSQGDTMPSTTWESLPSPDEAVTTTIAPAVELPSTTKPVYDKEYSEEEMREHSRTACKSNRDNAETIIAEMQVPAGVFFHGLCNGYSYWSFAYLGPESHIWYADFGTPFAPLGVGEYEGQLSDWPSIPLDARHPVFPDALTLGEIQGLAEGTTVCYRKSGGSSEELRVFGAFVYAYYYETMKDSGDPPQGYPAVNLGRALNPGYTWKWPTNDVGISPAEDGTWSVSHFTLGRCD